MKLADTLPQRITILPKISMTGRLVNTLHTPQESYQRLFEHLKNILPNASEEQIIKLIG